MNGLHLTADLLGCVGPGAIMTRPDVLRDHCLRAVRQAGLSAVGELFHRFDGEGGGGVTGVVLLAESHLAVHTWPELGAVTLDAYVCNVRADHSARAHALVDALVAAFAPAQVQRRQLQRGTLDAPATRSDAAAARPAPSPSVNASSNTE
jgi:S-adenosylmethionine decarboxylase